MEKTLKEFLKNNANKLTEGKMGWDPNKYASLEEWAGKRAHLIAEELRNKMGDKIDNVFPGDKIMLDISNPTDIKIEGLVRNYQETIGQEQIKEYPETNDKSPNDMENMKEGKEGIKTPEAQESTTNNEISEQKLNVAREQINHWPLAEALSENKKALLASYYAAATQFLPPEIVNPMKDENARDWSVRIAKELFQRGEYEEWKKTVNKILRLKFGIMEI